jgi:hypothetical protein
MWHVPLRLRAEDEEEPPQPQKMSRTTIVRKATTRTDAQVRFFIIDNVPDALSLTV